MSYASYPFGGVPFGGTRRRVPAGPGGPGGGPVQPPEQAPFGNVVDIIIESAGAPIMDDWAHFPAQSPRVRRKTPDPVMAFFAPHHTPPAFRGLFW